MFRTAINETRKLTDEVRECAETLERVGRMAGVGR
jgi:hypothetical protein